MALPIPGMVIERPRTALVITDLQNDFLSPGGVAWGLVKEATLLGDVIHPVQLTQRQRRILHILNFPTPAQTLARRLPHFPRE